MYVLRALRAFVLSLDCHSEMVALTELAYDRPVLGVVKILTFGGVKEVDSISVGFDYPAANNFQRAVQHQVLFCESFAQNGEGRRQPPFRKHPRMFAALTVSIYLCLQQIERRILAFHRLG